MSGKDPTQPEPTKSDGRRASRGGLPGHQATPVLQEVKMTPEEKAE